jgi:hypothetical protein
MGSPVVRDNFAVVKQASCRGLQRTPRRSALPWLETFPGETIAHRLRRR